MAMLFQYALPQPPSPRNRTKLGINFGVIGEGLFYKSAVLNQGFAVLYEKAQCLPRILLERVLGQVRRGAFLRTLEFMVALPNYTAVLAVGVPHLGTELLSAITAENSAGKRTLRRGAP